MEHAGFELCEKRLFPSRAGPKEYFWLQRSSWKVFLFFWKENKGLHPHEHCGGAVKREGLSGTLVLAQGGPFGGLTCRAQARRRPAAPLAD